MPARHELAAAAQRCAEVVRTFRPDVVYAPWVGEYHLDHHVLARVVRLALAVADFQGSAWGFEVWTPLIPTRIVDITARARAQGHRPGRAQEPARLPRPAGEDARLHGAARDVPAGRCHPRRGLRAAGRAVGGGPRTAGIGKERRNPTAGFLDRTRWRRRPRDGGSGASRPAGAFGAQRRRSLSQHPAQTKDPRSPREAPPWRISSSACSRSSFRMARILAFDVLPHVIQMTWGGGP